ncbi:MAG TPA: hypothetical protein VFZ58_03245 [Candidatus Saccharimonadales bacterium]
MSEFENTPRTVVSSSDYAEAFYGREAVNIPETSLLRGRIIRGKEPGDFLNLAADDRRLVFTMGGDGLSALCGRPLRQSLNTIGHTPAYVQGWIDQGLSFKLAVFQAEHERTLATWENLLYRVVECYPELTDDIAMHAPDLPHQLLPAEIELIDLAGPSHPEFVSLARYQRLTPEERADPQTLRRLLLHEMHVSALFGGDGYTYTPGGHRSMKEHLMPNLPLEALRETVLINLDESRR